MPFPGQAVLVIGYNPPRKGKVIRVCEKDPNFWWVDVEGYGPERIRGRKFRPERVKEAKDEG